MDDMIVEILSDDEQDNEVCSAYEDDGGGSDQLHRYAEYQLEARPHGDNDDGCETDSIPPAEESAVFAELVEEQDSQHARIRSGDENEGRTTVSLAEDASHKRRRLHTSFPAGACAGSDVMGEREQARLTRVETERDNFLRQLRFLEAAYKSLRDRFEAKCRELSKERSKLKKQLQEARHSGSSLVAVGAIENTQHPVTAKWPFDEKKFKDSMEQLQARIDATTEEVRSEKKRNIYLEGQVQTLQAQFTSHQALSRVDESFQALETQADELRQRLRQVEAENRSKTRELQRIRGRLENQAKLEEQVDQLQSKLIRAQTALDSSEELHKQLEVLTQERKDWESSFVKLVPVQPGTQINPILALKTLAQFQSQCFELQERIGQLQTKLKVAEAAKDDLSRQVEELNISMQKNSTEMEQMQRTSRVYEKQFALYNSEIQSARELLKTYEDEFIIGRPTDDRLTRMLESHKEHTERIQRLLDEARAQVGNQARLLANPDDSEVIVGLRRDLLEARARVQALLEEKTKQNKLVEHHSDVLTATQTNPFAEVREQHLQQELQALKEENSRLRANVQPQVNDAESTHASSRSLTGSGPLNFSAAQLDLSVDSSKLDLRLKEKFKERIDFFRKCVTLLTGYSIDLLTSGTNPKIRLRSLFAEAQEDEMLFEVLDVDQEQLQLLDTPFVASLEPRLFDYLTKTHSIPAFLSSVTLALFERQTFMGT